MKNIARCFVFLFMLIMAENCFAQEWIPFQYNTMYTAQQCCTQVQYQPQPIIVYQLVPQVIQQNIIVEKRCFFQVTQTVVTRPIVQYVYQPVVIYK